MLTLDVHNDGHIPSERMDAIFSPFSREKSEQPRPGLGLGIYIASEIARAHGGTLEVESSAATGTLFTFKMPRLELP